MGLRYTHRGDGVLRRSAQSGRTWQAPDSGGARSSRPACITWALAEIGHDRFRRPHDRPQRDLPLHRVLPTQRRRHRHGKPLGGTQLQAASLNVGAIQGPLCS